MLGAGKLVFSFFAVVKTRKFGAGNCHFDLQDTTGVHPLL